MFLSYEKCSLILKQKFQHRKEKKLQLTTAEEDKDEAEDDDNKVIKKLGTGDNFFHYLYDIATKGNKGAEWLNILTIITYNLKVLLFTLISSPPTEVISLAHFIYPCLEETNGTTLERVNE